MAKSRNSYKRVLLKLSGEVFGGEKGVGVDPDVVHDVATQIAEVVRSGVEVAIVVGGGNYFRGAELQERGMDRARADYMGMLGTVMNCLALQDFLEKAGIDTRVQTAIAMGQVAEPYIPRRSIRHLEKGRVTGFVKEVSLLEQAFAKDQKKSVQQILTDAGNSVSAFYRFRVGQ